MKTLSFALLSLALIASIQPAEAKTYNVKYMGEGALKAACARGGGSFNSGTNDYACTYKNGNIRDCNRQTKKCVTETPPQIEIIDVGVYDTSILTSPAADTSGSHGGSGAGAGNGGDSGGNPMGGTFNAGIGGASMSTGGGGSVIY